MIESIFVITAIITVLTGKYEYSFDKYPYDIYDHFMEMITLEGATDRIMNKIYQISSLTKQIPNSE